MKNKQLSKLIISSIALITPAIVLSSCNFNEQPSNQVGAEITASWYEDKNYVEKNVDASFQEFDRAYLNIDLQYDKDKYFFSYDQDSSMLWGHWNSVNMYVDYTSQNRSFTFNMLTTNEQWGRSALQARFGLRCEFIDNNDGSLTLEYFEPFEKNLNTDWTFYIWMQFYLIPKTAIINPNSPVLPIDAIEVLYGNEIDPGTHNPETYGNLSLELRDI